MLLKINIFKIEKDCIDNLTVDLEDNGYEVVTDHEDEHCYTALYLRKKHSENQGWIGYYKNMLDEITFAEYAENLGSESVSGVFLIETESYAYTIVHGQAHFVVRKYCNKDFGLDLAERILDSVGLKMKHSQTFTSEGKKDITSYIHKRKLDDSREYGEAFSYIKCKTVDKKLWGESADFGESARFTFGKDFAFGPTELYHLTDRINSVLGTESTIKLPRYRKVFDRTILNYLDTEFMHHFMDYLTDVDMDDYWLTGVSFNFSNDFRCSLRIRKHDMTEILDTLDIGIVREAICANAEYINNRYDLIKVIFYDENDESIFTRSLKDLMQVTIEYNGKYYVLLHNEWVEFSESYVSYIEEQVDNPNNWSKIFTNNLTPKII